MTGFTLLWSKILDSSIWKESPTTRVVWITLLAMKDSEGIVHASLSGVAHRSRVKVSDARRAMKIFLSPDPESSNQAEEGRRIREVPGGWQIINHEFYRYSTEEKREFWRKQKAEQRAKKDGIISRSSAPLTGEKSYQMAVEAGASRAQMEAILDLRKNAGQS